MANLDDLKKSIDTLVASNQRDHERLFEKLDMQNERITRVEEKQKTIWGVIAAVGAAVAMLVVNLLTDVFKR